MPTPPRSVKIAENERGGWSSERPRRPGEPERPPRLADVSVRGRVLAPSDRLRYAPGSLLLLVGADAPTVEALGARVLEDPSSLLSLAKLRGMLEGRVPEGEVDEKARALLDATAAKRLASGQTVVIALESLDAIERERYVRAALPHRRPRHLILVETGKANVAEEDRADARRAADRARRRRDGPGGLRDLAAPRRAHGRRAQADRVRAAAEGRLSRGYSGDGAARDEAVGRSDLVHQRPAGRGRRR